MIQAPIEDYRVLATLCLDDATEHIDDVICKVYLPKRTADRARLVLLPNNAQEKRLRGAHVVSVHAELRQPNGDLTVITSRQTLITKRHSTAWGPSLREHVVPGDPSDLQIETVFQSRVVEQPHRLDGCFWLSRNRLLSNVSERSFSYTGEVTIHKLAPLVITLANGLPISFTVHSRYAYPNESDTLMFDENVAHFNVSNDMFTPKTIEDSLPHLEDVLRLVSFVGEYPCVCLGWLTVNSHSHIEFFQGRKNPFESLPSVHDAIVNYSDFADFLPTAYKAFLEIEPKAALRRALDYIVLDAGESLESSYIMLYAAVETLVLFFRRQRSLEFIFSDEVEWTRLNSDLEGWLKKHPVLSAQKEKRKFLYEKLSELKRYSFSAAFKKFCEHYEVDLHDLWPMVGGGSEDSLSAIRNKLVHGEVYEPKRYHALMGAREHLRWSIYRMIFGMLRWPIDRTKVDAKHLARSPIHKSLAEDRSQISS